MGLSKQEFIQVRMQMATYQSLEQQQREQMEIRLIDESGWQEEYEKDEAWKGLKTRSQKAYKELKKREFEIRNNKK